MPKRSQPVLTLTAAAKRINMADPQAAKRDAAKSKPWHAEAWGYFDEVPEIKESIRYRGNQLGKVRLFVAVANPDDPTADPVPVNDPDSGVPPGVAAAATAELARLRSRMGGQAEIMRMLDMNLEVVGEAYLIGYSERAGVTVVDPVTNIPKLEGYQPEDWMIRSVSEVEVKGSGASAKYLVKADPSDTKGVELDAERDTIMRIWLRHPQWASQADCAMRGLLGDCRILQVLSQQLLAHSYRALSAGMLTIPNELGTPTGDPTKPEEPVDDPLMDTLYEVLSGPITDPTSPSTVQPALLRGPGAFLGPDFVRRITFYDKDVIEGIEARIEARIGRIARGLNLPVEKIMGHQSTTYANASQVDEDEFNDYLAPSAETAVEALTFAFLTPQLEEAGGEAAAWADRLFVWYDPSDLIAQPDAEKHALEAHQANAISDAALRRSFGFGEEDAPEALELLQRAGLRRGILTADLTLALLNLLGIPIEVEDSAEVEDPNAEAVAMLAQMMAGARPRPIRAASRPSSPDYGRRLTEIDRELRSRLLVASNVAMGTALDRAANRLRTKTNGSSMRASLQNVPRRCWFAQLGPTLVAEAMGDEDPLDGAWDGLEDEFRAWGNDAQARARTTAGQAVGGDLSELEPQQADDLDGAWLWFAAALTGLAVARLWTPDPSAPTIGEYDPTVMIPAGMVRQAVARAGGAQGLITGGQDAWVTLTDAGTRPAGGIGTGDLIRGALRDGGATIEGYVWRYGPGFRQRPFEGHLRLDSQPFANFDDDVLASDGTFGFSYWLPGDHSGSLAAGTLVSGPAPTGAALRHWRGDLIDLSFASGEFLSATPNHPVLTGRGWVPAGELVEGDEVVRCRDTEGIPGLVPDYDQMPARIEDVVAAVSMTEGWTAVGVPVSPMNFHGDGEGSEVAVVWTNRLLHDRGDSTLGQPSGQPALSFADAYAKTLPGGGPLGERFGGVGNATLGDVGSLGHGPPLLGGSLGGEQVLGARPSPALNPGLQELGLDDVPVDAEALGKSLLGLAGLVELDKVTNVDRRSGFSGHVYDLQTATRWYVANGVIVHNCICDFEPTILGADER